MILSTLTTKPRQLNDESPPKRGKKKKNFLIEKSKYEDEFTGRPAGVFGRVPYIYVHATHQASSFLVGSKEMKEKSSRSGEFASTEVLDLCALRGKEVPQGVLQPARPAANASHGIGILGHY